ncbi:hydrogenase nickel incorporation protein HypB [Caballeronia sordidicola]|uniref:Hydrogenase maturation factor HypB n=1 Tax=Caballeronia sordidicola TaxID=196367 RepID=A0A226WVI6_CABSO|nr:hydrogenase nickel incorporation protein HypB [Caballeronia sordidicola]OXC74859.1 [NiFe] hydrogenase nickel incorporation-associated protein HypB [Caballeronia sordidicola]
MCTTCGCSKGAGTVITDPETGERIETRAEGDSEAARNPGSWRQLAAGPAGASVAAHLHARAHRHAHEAHVHEHDGHVHSHEHHHAQTPAIPDHPGAEHTPVSLSDVAIAAATHGTTIALEQDVLAKNQLLAEHNRGWLASRHITALNLVSSPGAGKTTLLERTIRDLQALNSTRSIQVIEGDQATLNDAERIRATGCRVVQINTGTGCHLDAGMVSRALAQLDPPSHAWLMIENVGNLVCPALFDLGEQAKVVILSVTEGEDKPLKYPHMFRASRLMLLNKIDLLPHLRFDVERCIAYAGQVNPSIEVLQVSAETGAGMKAWYAWLEAAALVEVAETVRQSTSKSAVGSC